MSSEFREPPRGLRRRMAGLRSALPGSRRELLATAVSFGPAVGMAILLEMTFDVLLPVIPRGLTLAVALLLLSVRWLRRRAVPPPLPVGPQRLPPRVEPLVGREAELEKVTGLAVERGLVVVRGVGGIGTSALAVNAGWGLAPEPERQYYADLRGQDPDGPEDAASVMERVLRTLGRPLGPAESAGGAEQEVVAALQDTGALLLLDNVERWSQVRWLPHRVRGSRLVIAGDLKVDTGDRIPRDVAVVQVGPLNADDTVTLLRSPSTADRIEADPAATRKLAELFLRRPAVTVEIRGWLTENPYVSMAGLLNDLGQEPHDRTLQKVRTMQLARVSPAARRLLALLAKTPIAEVGIDAATALAGGPESAVTAAMEELSRHGLTVKVRESRIRLVDGARAIAPPPDDPQAARQRLVEHFADRADRSAELLPHEEAWAWFSTEDRALLQILKEPSPAPWAAGPLWRIADALEVWFSLEQRHQERREAARALAHAATVLGDPDVRATAELRLCLTALVLGEPREAQRHFDAAAGLQSGVESWPAQLHLARASTLLAGGDEFAAVESSLVQYGQALPGGDATGQATRWINMAVLQMRRGQVCGFKDETDQADRLYADALSTLVQALGIARQAEDVHAEAHARELLALVHWYLDRAHDAAANWQKAAELYERSRDRIGLARCQVHRAATMPKGSHEEAAALLRSAVGRLPATGVSTALARLHLARMEPRNARSECERGLAALTPWDGMVEPLQVTEIRRRLEDLRPDGPFAS